MTRKTEMVALFQSGLPMEDVGRRFGVSKQRVHQVLKAMNVDSGTGGRAEQTAKKTGKLDAFYRENFGCDRVQYILLRDEMREIGMQMKAAGLSPNRTPRGAFKLQKNNAKQRGIAWQLSLWEWWNIWRKSGHWHERGRTKGRFGMCRKGDVGPYSIENVFIGLHSENVSEAQLGKPERRRVDNELRSL